MPHTAKFEKKFEFVEEKYVAFYTKMDQPNMLIEQLKICAVQIGRKANM